MEKRMGYCSREGEEDGTVSPTRFVVASARTQGWVKCAETETSDGWEVDARLAPSPAAVTLRSEFLIGSGCPQQRLAC